MNKVKKDNLTDLVSDLMSEVDSNEKPENEQSQGLSDYQVLTPSGEIVDLAFTGTDVSIKKSGDETSVRKLLVGETGKDGLMYVLLVVKKD